MTTLATFPLCFLLVLLMQSKGTCSCTITAISANDHNLLNRYSFQGSMHIVYVYGDDVTVFCTAADTTHLTILDKSGELLPATQYNSTTVQVSIKKPDLGWHVYYCKDSNTGCNDILQLNFKPAVNVVAPGVRHILDTEKTTDKYFVPRGNNYDVFCTADNVDPQSLKLRSHVPVKKLTLFPDGTFVNMTYPATEKLQTRAINTTTLAATLSGDIEQRTFQCGDRFFDVVVDENPEAKDFWCNLHFGRNLQCAWSSSSQKNTFMLFKENTFLCSDMSGNLAAGCARGWHEDLDKIQYNTIGPFIHGINFSFRLEACNELFCRNQTFVINPLLNATVDPISSIETDNNSAAVTWRHKARYCSYNRCEYKVEYKTLGSKWNQVDSSSRSCFDLSFDDVFCTLHLPSLCSESVQYQLRVYVRYLTLSNIGNTKWSGPAEMSFFARSKSDGTCRFEPLP